MTDKFGIRFWQYVYYLGGVDMKNVNILREEQLEMVTGGQVNENFNPDNIDYDGLGIDEFVNGKNYEWLADKIVEWLNRNNPNSSYTKRNRAVNNNVSIYDFD